MKRKNNKGILVDGSLRSAGVTFFTRNGQTVVRTSASMQPERRTLAQFESRERMAHTLSLWHYLHDTCVPLFTLGLQPRSDFFALAAKLPALYLTQREHAAGAALLVPGIPVSSGTLPDIGYRLGTHDGQPALLTDMAARGLNPAADRYLLVTLVQQLQQGVPHLTAASEEVAPERFVVADEGLALVDPRFGDASCGWALVRRRGDRCSTQTVVTASTLYRAWLTDEALERAAASYGGLTP